MKKQLRLAAVLAALLAMSAAVFASPHVVRAASGPTFTVTTFADAVDAHPGDGSCAAATSSPAAGKCSLRAAIMEANAERFNPNPPASFTINLPAGSYSLTIVGADEDEAASGDLDIRVAMSILATGGSSAMVAGASGWNDRIFDVNPDAAGAQVQLTGLIIEGGHTSSFGGGILSRGPSTATQHLTLANTIVTNNTSANGGGVFSSNRNELILTASTVSGNTASPGSGGGIAVPGSSATLDVKASTVSGNTALTGGGGGISNGGTATLTNSTLSGNTAGGGGGGIENSVAGKTMLNNVTVAANKADEGGGIMNGSALTTAVNLANTIVATNTATSSGPDCFGTLTSSGFNLIGDTIGGCTLSGTTTGSILNQEPRLGPLQDNGGPTKTQALLQTNSNCPLKGPCALYNPSLGIDAGNPATPGSGGAACPATDQRGIARPLDGNGDGTARCDMGAYEAHAL